MNTQSPRIFTVGSLPTEAATLSHCTLYTRYLLQENRLFTRIVRGLTVGEYHDCHCRRIRTVAEAAQFLAHRIR
jgi:hypothetical protein